MAKFLENLTVDEVSLVDEPANKGAKVVLFKRDLGAVKKVDGNDFYRSDFAYTPNPEDSSTWKFLLVGKSGGEIENKLLEEFAKAIEDGFKFEESEVEKVFAKVRDAWHEANPGKDDQDMPKALTKANYHMEESNMSKELEEKVTKLQADIALAGAITKASIGLVKASKKEDFDAISAELAKMDEKNPEVIALKASVTDGLANLEKGTKKSGAEAFKTKLPKSLQKAFDEMDEKEQSAFMEKYKADDKEDTLGKALDKLSKANDGMQERLDRYEKQDRISKLLNGDLKDVPDAASLAESVIKLQDVDADAAKALVEKMKAQAAQLKEAGLFNVIGKDGGEGASAEEKLEKMAKALSASDKISFEKAYEKVMESNPDLYKATLGGK